MKSFCQGPWSEAIICIATSCSEIRKSFKLGVDSCVKCYKVSDVWKLVTQKSLQLAASSEIQQCLENAWQLKGWVKRKKKKKKQNLTFRIRTWNMFLWDKVILLYITWYIYPTYCLKCIFQSRLYYLYFGLLLYIFKYMFWHLILLGQNDVKLTMKKMSSKLDFFIEVKIIHMKEKNLFCAQAFPSDNLIWFCNNTSGTSLGWQPMPEDLVHLCGFLESV